MFVILAIQHAMGMRHFVICGPSGSTTFFRFISQKALFSKKITEYNVFFSLQFPSVIFLILRRIQRDIAIKCTNVFM